jgi:hypothetical protein
MIKRRTEGYLLAEGSERSDEIAGRAVVVDAELVEARADVDKARSRVVEQVPEGDENRASDRDKSALATPRVPAGDSALTEKVSVLPAPEATSPRMPFKQQLPLPALPVRMRGPDWIVRGESFAHETKWPAVGELGHVKARAQDPREPPGHSLR